MKAIENLPRKPELQEVHVPTISLFHHLLDTAPFGVLRGMGNSHVSDCNCKTCQYVRKGKAR